MSPKAKRNIAGILLAIGIVGTVIRAIEVISMPQSGKAWFELLAMCILTFVCFLSFLDYPRQSSQAS